MDEASEFPVFVDERGTLLPIEFDDVPFNVRRVFVVRGVEGGRERGQHLADCEELIVLVAGRAVVQLSRDASAVRTITLTEPGQSLRIGRADYVSYRLDESSEILVLASERFTRAGGRE